MKKTQAGAEKIKALYTGWKLSGLGFKAYYQKQECLLLPSFIRLIRFGLERTLLPGRPYACEKSTAAGQRFACYRKDRNAAAFQVLEKKLSSYLGG